VDPAFRALAAAVVSARLQARKALLDIQDRAAASPACWLVVPSVTLNRAERDTEILCGVYFLNAAESGVAPRYQGLGDDPAGYRIRLNVHGLTVEDDHLSQMRPGRDHRAIVRERLGGLMPAATADERLERLRSDVSADRHHDHRHAQSLHRIALPIMAEIAPVPVALLLFAEGAVSIHHAFRIDRLARELEGSEEAREILEEVHARVDHLDPDRAEALVELLVTQYAG
jgi:hypothetical protein